ncbi:MAG: hypothetical protein EOP45_23785 [Sphingobacteriaceae bacterium]|nr:MAG: hypothetical protein EOP45_23785 [Sphingobacteriaceae bacterium]
MTEEMMQFMIPCNIQHFEHHMSISQFHGASDILRYELIQHYGGIYVDLDFEPPRSSNGDFVDWFTFASSTDLTCCSEHHSRNIHPASFYCMNGLFSAPRNHPILKNLVHSLDNNINKWVQTTGSLNACYSTGPFLLTRMLQTRRLP